MMQQTLLRATLNDLYEEPGQAELVVGRIVRFISTGFFPNLIAGRIFRKLSEYADHYRHAIVGTDNLGYALQRPLPSGRESFSPDVSFHTGPRPRNRMRFIEGPPAFAIEVRSECDYAPGAFAVMAEKRADYFEAGTQLVWDVDPLNGCIHAYTAATAQPARTFLRGDTAEAETVAPGWRIDVSWIFEE